jgi:polyferredoxin
LLVGYVGLIAGEMLSQALFAGWAKHGTPWRSAPGLVLVGLVALLAPVVTRRQLYCHHVCPHGSLQQLLMKRVRWQWHLPKWLEVLPFVLLGVVLFAVTFGWGLNLNSVEPFDAYVWKIAGLASLLIAVVGLVVSVFVPMGYCRFGCPTGALFKLLRYAGAEDVLGRRDMVTACVVAGLWIWRFAHA